MSYSFLILILFHGMVRCVALNGRSYPPSSALPNREGVLPRIIPGVILVGFSFFHLLTHSLMEVFSYPQPTSSPRIGPLAQHIHRFGLPSLLPPQYVFSINKQSIKKNTQNFCFVIYYNTIIY